MNPTQETYKPLNDAYDFFNKELFGSTLPGCLITMQRKGKARGYFCPERFETRTDNQVMIHEIALNPSLFKDRSDAEILSTLVHEMIHLWQEEDGSAPKRGYHNKEWAKKMEEMGLMPSNTGEEGGKKTGHSVSHYIVPGGKFDVLIKKFFAENDRKVLYQDRPEIKLTGTKKRNKIKYTCPRCGLNMWGKPNANILCGDDNVKLTADGEEVEK
jgi:hypothetical protein